jgi:hypothetical protein
LAGVFAKANTLGGAPANTTSAASTEPWRAASPAAYAGTYTVPGLGFVLHVEAAPTGELTITGEEPAADGLSPARPVSFRNVQLQDGQLTATKVDEFGLEHPFSAAFLQRVGAQEATPGLGTELTAPLELNGLVLKKLFYQKQR